MTAPTVPDDLIVLQHLDPAALQADQNIRLALVDPELKASIREHGVLVPVLAQRTADGQIRVYDGHRRVLTAIHFSQDTIPVLVTGAEGEGTAARAARMMRQYEINDNRAGLTTGEKAAFVQALLELEVSPAQIHRKTRIGKAEIAAAKTVAGSRVAMAQASVHGHLTLDQGLGLAEFDTDPDAVEALITASGEGQGPFRLALEELRDKRDDAAAKAAAKAALEALGVRVLDGGMGYQNALYQWCGPDGETLTAEAHGDCPGHVAVLYHRYRADDPHHYEPSFYCEDPKGNGHKTRPASNGTGPAPEGDAAERRRVLAGNKAWRTAGNVRREWLATDLLARQKPPDGALRFVLAALARRDEAVRKAFERGHSMARGLLGIAEAAGEPGLVQVHEIADALEAASDGRAVVIALGMILGAYEQVTQDVQTWRCFDAGQRGGSAADASLYLAALARWGHYPSPAEQCVIDGKAWTETAS